MGSQANDGECSLLIVYVSSAIHFACHTYAMCFSAPASFVASGILAAGGVASLHETRDVRTAPLASFPLIFAAQQAVEGMVWLTLGKSTASGLFVYLYTMMSHVLWPVLTPIAVLLIEPDPVRKKLLRMSLAVGSVVALYLMYSMHAEPVTAQIIEESISYRSPNLYPTVSFLMYLIATCGSCFLSSHRLINFFGAVLFLAFLVSYLAFQASFFSVWCFFAALLSLLVYLHMRIQNAGGQ